MGNELSIKNVLLKSSIFLLSFFLLFLMASAVCADDAEKRVLSLNSYQQEFSWTDQQLEADVKMLKQSGLNTACNVEYMGWKPSGMHNSPVMTNSPFSFFKQYGQILSVMVIIFILMTVHSTILSLNIRKRKRVEAELLNKNKEITEVYEELAASDEELLAQLEELTDSQEKLSLSEQRYKLVVEASNDVIWDWDLKSGQRVFSNKWYEILGYTREEILTSDQWNSLIHPADLEQVLHSIQQHLEGKSAFYSSEYRIRQGNGEYRWVLAKGKALLDKSHQPYRMIGAYTDITELKENEQKIWRMAYVDSLTELPNRACLNEYVNEHINGDQHKKNRMALIYIDVDNFKLVNDTYGHTEGDWFLKEIGRRISSTARGQDKIFRIGGDEFVMIRKYYQDKEQVEKSTVDLMESLKAPVTIHENIIYASISAGIVLYPEHGETFEELFKNADSAMYYVKENGKRGYSFFDKKINEALLEKMNLEKSLRKAIDNNEFVLFYQPQTSMESGEILGFEALIRWLSPELGMVPPNRFIRIAEETGLIIPIGEWVLKTACSFAAALQKEQSVSKFMSINLSTLQLRQPDFVDKVIGIMRETKVAPSIIHLEITETILMDSFENSIAKLNQLKALGVHISLDDFGTGYSSLTYLRKLPINTLKIDKSFVDDIPIAEGNKQIINSMIQLAHSLGLVVVAEGVEEEIQFQYLKNSKCDMIQGYYISKPVGEAEVAGLLNHHIP
jgi:diguanylate cyclase (GGDEF)-like protein/PAS domain S-box-containing protein